MKKEFVESNEKFEMLILVKNGTSLGAVNTQQILSELDENEKILILKNEKIPICKIVSKKDVYESKKREKQNKQKNTKTKEYKLSPYITDWDLSIKAKNATKNLENGNGVKLICLIKNENSKEMAETIFKKFVDLIQKEVELQDFKAKHERNHISTTLLKKTRRE